MSKIKAIRALEILDSRGTPTIEVILLTDRDITVKAAIPSGASTGEHEAVELRDGDKKRYFGKGVKKAVAIVNHSISNLLVGKSVFDQISIDDLLIQADGSAKKEKFGANAILGASLAVAKAAAATVCLPLYRYIGGCHSHILPCPMMNIINGGAHADNLLDFQEFMIRPIGAPSFSEGLRSGVEVFYTLKNLLKKRGHVVSVGDEGGFAPRLESNEMAFEFICEAIEKAGYKAGKDLSIAIDCAASGFYDKSQKKYVEKKKQEAHQPYIERTQKEHIDYLCSLTSSYPIDSIEDGMDENDWEGWKLLSEKLNSKIQLVGDDIFVTDCGLLKRGIQEGIANSILIKLNQIGTLTETLRAIELAKTHGYKSIISHRSGETEDTTIADLAVAVNCGQIKTGSLSRTDRIAKYNRLIEIEAELGLEARY